MFLSLSVCVLRPRSRSELLSWVGGCLPGVYRQGLAASHVQSTLEHCDQNLSEISCIFFKSCGQVKKMHYFILRFRSSSS